MRRCIASHRGGASQPQLFVCSQSSSQILTWGNVRLIAQPLNASLCRLGWMQRESRCLQASVLAPYTGSVARHVLLQC